MSTPSADEVTMFATGLAEMAENMAPLREATKGYRQAAIADGFSASAAEQMAVDYHRYLLEIAIRSIGGAS